MSKSFEYRYNLTQQRAMAFNVKLEWNFHVTPQRIVVNRLT